MWIWNVGNNGNFKKRELFIFSLWGTTCSPAGVRKPFFWPKTKCYNSLPLVSKANASPAQHQQQVLWVGRCPVLRGNSSPAPVTTPYYNVCFISFFLVPGPFLLRVHWGTLHSPGQSSAGNLHPLTNHRVSGPQAFCCPLRFPSWSPLYRHSRSQLVFRFDCQRGLQRGNGDWHAT